MFIRLGGILPYQQKRTSVDFTLSALLPPWQLTHKDRVHSLVLHTNFVSFSVSTCFVTVRNSSEGIKASLTIFNTRSTTYFIFTLCGYCCILLQQSIVAAFWSPSKVICRPFTITRSLFGNFFRINLSLQRSLFPYEDKSRCRSRLTNEEIKILPSLVTQ